MGTYDVAQICENGHVITDQLRSYPEQGKSFCDRCGAPTLSQCRQCAAEIPGHYEREWAIAAAWYVRPSFCRGCGRPYPWTQTAIEEAKKLTALAEKLSQRERDQLASDIDDLVCDTPRTQGAILRLKLLPPKLGTEVWGAMKVILVNVATDVVKKELGIG